MTVAADEQRFGHVRERSRTLIAGDGGSVLVRGAQSPDAVALACEGLAAPAAVPSGLPVYPADAIPGDLDVDAVELLACEPVTADAVGAWARARSVALARAEPAQLPSPVRIVAVSACSTGSGKTALVRRVARALQRSGRQVAVVRHPIASLLAWDRFAPSVKRAPSELVGPVEEREELAPLVGAGIPVVTGLDPDGLLRLAAREAEVIVWDGGGAAPPWVTPDLHLVAVDLLRPLPEGASERIASADAVVLTKADSAAPERVREIEERVREINDHLLLADLTVGVQDGPALRDRRAVLVEDWPSLVLGGLAAGAAAVAARRFRCGVVDPRPFAVGAIRDVLESHSHIGAVIPSLGRTPKEIADFAESVYATPGDVVLWASNADPAGVISGESRPVIRAYGELTEVAGPSLQQILAEWQPAPPGP